MAGVEWQDAEGASKQTAAERDAGQPVKTRAQRSVRGVTCRYPPPRCKYPRMGPVAAAVPYRSAPHPDAGALIEILEQARTLRRPSGCSFANCKSESAGRSLQLRPGEGDILHDHGPGALARHSRTDMAAARGHVTKPMSAVFRVAGTGSTRADAVVIRSHASLGRQPQAVRLESKLARQLAPD